MDQINSRRSFLKNAIVATTAISLLSGNTTLAKNSDEPKLIRPLKILILGGTSFLGPHQIAYALDRGHSVSTFTRGKTKPSVHRDLFDNVEMLIGDRVDNLQALKNRKWDVVIDNSGRDVQWTKDTAELLKDNVGLYVYISSVSVYYPYYSIDVKENYPLVMEIPSDLKEGEQGLYDYGVMKANSEKAALHIFGKERTIIIRPTFMTGPADRTDRFMYWPVQLGKGGDILVPGTTEDAIQFIDVRDIAQWMIRLIENGSTGTYNGSGPAAVTNIAAFVKDGSKAFDKPLNEVAIDDHAFLEKEQISFMAPWIAPSPKFAGISKVNVSKAIASGITYRPISETIKDTHDWWYSDAVDEDRRNKFETDTNGILMKAPEVTEKWKLKNRDK